jgi:predicted transglutaminase-like cysteine proteinase
MRVSPTPGMGCQMGIFAFPQFLRATALACGLLSMVPATRVEAGTLLSPGTATLLRRSIEPFGRPTAILLDGGLHDKWVGLQRRFDDDMVQLALCDGDRGGCVSPAALKLLAIVDDARSHEGLARIGDINRAINLAIRPMSDLAQYGELDVWSSPLVTLAHGAGDCEDYAIAKLTALRLAGIADDDLRIVVMHDTISGEDHAVAAARQDGRWLMLDNRRMAMIEDSNMRNIRPLFVIDQRGVNRYVEAPRIALNGT